ncbi:expressed protein [Phakopsora pachyrhizi]|uniref:Expressed protein n=1 Tax=Phakopsora pachyrhizi TaxID=170000 RepID=A0AAV0BNF8_PHAPC|nr:expressed protein [Phakopsora pachyrhizi]
MLMVLSHLALGLLRSNPSILVSILLVSTSYLLYRSYNQNLMRLLPSRNLDSKNIVIFTTVEKLSRHGSRPNIIINLSGSTIEHNDLQLILLLRHSTKNPGIYLERCHSDSSDSVLEFIRRWINSPGQHQQPSRGSPHLTNVSRMEANNLAIDDRLDSIIFMSPISFGKVLLLVQSLLPHLIRLQARSIDQNRMTTRFIVATSTKTDSRRRLENSQRKLWNRLQIKLRSNHSPVSIILTRPRLLDLLWCCAEDVDRLDLVGGKLNVAFCVEKRKIEPEEHDDDDREEDLNEFLEVNQKALEECLSKS